MRYSVSGIPRSDGWPASAALPAALLLLVFLVLQAGSARAESKDLVEALDDYADGEYSEAAEQLRPLADAGNAIALYYLARLYDDGLGVRLDRGMAANLFVKAAEAGHVESQRVVGVLYEEGRALPQDFGAAAQWYRRAADGGNTKAMANLGRLLDLGLGMKEDPEAAVGWYQKAAEAGNSKAMRRLASHYEAGRGVAADPAMATQWLERAAMTGNVKAMNKRAEQLLRETPERQAEGVEMLREAAHAGSSASQYRLGLAYLYGDGVDVDEARALAWLILAESNGSGEAAERVNALEQQVGGDVLLRARALVPRLSGLAQSMPED